MQCPKVPGMLKNVSERLNEKSQTNILEDVSEKLRFHGALLPMVARSDRETGKNHSLLRN
jgi:hypothetical protein